MSPRYQTTEYNRAERVKSRLQAIFSEAIAFHHTADQILSKLTALYATEDYRRLTAYYSGYVTGLREGLNQDIWRNHVAWCLGPASGPIRQTPSEWTLEMSNLCRLPGQLYGGHYWTDDKGIATEHLYTEYKPIN